MILLIFSLTASYSQTVLSNSQAKFFIKQDAELKYLRVDNKDLIKRDSLNTIVIGNYKNIVNINDSVINTQRFIINDKSRVLMLSEREMKSVRTDNSRLRIKIKARNKVILISFTMIISEALFIYLTY